MKIKKKIQRKGSGNEVFIRYQVNILTDDTLCLHDTLINDKIKAV